ncbi:TPA: hypothetical protein N0F65_003570, partial [Lagenidium giganteum]
RQPTISTSRLATTSAFRRSLSNKIINTQINAPLSIHHGCTVQAFHAPHHWHRPRGQESHRLLAPMTRARSSPDVRCANALNEEYYEQHAGAGLIVTEGTGISEEGHGWFGAPACYNEAHAEAWKKVTDRVHKKGSKIFLQLWHLGRQGHPSFNAKNDLVAPSAIGLAQGTVRTAQGDKVPYAVPRALETDEIAGVVDDYRKCAEYAKKAGFDGVEVHGANGYLVDEFLQSVSNKRTDKYGGSFENRYRFLEEIVEALKTVYPANRIAVRLSPNGAFGGMGSEDNYEMFTYAMEKLSKHGLAYLAILDGFGFGTHDKGRLVTAFDAKTAFKGVVMANCSYTKEIAEGVVRSGAADLVSFGRPYISTPDLAERFQNDWPLNPPAQYPDYWDSSRGADHHSSSASHLFVSKSNMAAPFKLFTPLKLGRDLVLKNRVVLAPMTRARSVPDTRCANALNETYYEQRAGAGLIVTEGVGISEQGHGWFGAPACYNDAHADAWKRVTDRVHKKDGKIFMQLWHLGRQGHPSFNAKNDLVAPSAIGLTKGIASNSKGELVPYATPRALETSEIPCIVEDYAKSAEFAKKAGFDGVEVHGANGYLVDVFLQSVSNKRTDKYGGSFENRYRFLDEIVEALKSVYSPNHVAVRLSPNGAFGGMGSKDNYEMFTYAMEKLGKHGLGYLAILDGFGFGTHDKGRLLTAFDAKTAFKGVVMANCSYTKEIAEGVVRSGSADLVSFGRPYISNPDLAERFQHDWPLNADADHADYWDPTRGARGYTDFPFHSK